MIQFIRGFFMALADSVPGVSGGSIAFIMGFYDNFINSLSSLVSVTSLKEKKPAFIFLMKLGLGWIVGMILSILTLASLFEAHIYSISSLFIGFILFSIPLIIKEEKPALVKNYGYLIFSLLGIIVVVSLTYFNPVNSSSSISFSDFSWPLALYIFVAGMIAISAMVLPGISGSTLLLIFGLYVPTITAIKSFLTLDFSVVPLLFCLGLGIITGIIVAIRSIHYLLERYHSQMIYLILGLMIGSFYPVFMGPTTLEIPRAPMTLQSFDFIFFFIGALLIMSIEKMKTISETK